MDWGGAARRAIDHVGKPGRKYPPAVALALIDFLAVQGRVTRIELQERAPPRTPNPADFVGTILGHVTTAVRGDGAVPAVGGWYGLRAAAGLYEVNPAFAAAWRVGRDL